MTLSHFQALLLFSFLISVVFGCLTRRTAAARFRSGVLAFLLFIVLGAAVGWLLYPISR